MDSKDTKLAGLKTLPDLTEEQKERFWSYVDKTGDCWNWIGHILESGYAQFRVGEYRYRVHRLAYFLYYEEQPEGIVMHTCDNRCCCNPLHLRDGTNAENSQDMVNKGRSVSHFGERHGRSKLQNDDVLAIRNHPGSNQQIAKLFNVSKGMVWRIRTRKNWTHI